MSSSRSVPPPPTRFGSKQPVGASCCSSCSPGAAPSRMPIQAKLSHSAPKIIAPPMRFPVIRGTIQRASTGGGGDDPKSYSNAICYSPDLLLTYTETEIREALNQTAHGVRGHCSGSGGSPQNSQTTGDLAALTAQLRKNRAARPASTPSASESSSSSAPAYRPSPAEILRHAAARELHRATVAKSKRTTFTATTAPETYRPAWNGGASAWHK